MITTCNVLLSHILSHNHLLALLCLLSQPHPLLVILYMLYTTTKKN